MAAWPLMVATRAAAGTASTWRTVAVVMATAIGAWSTVPVSAWRVGVMATAMVGGPAEESVGPLLEGWVAMLPMEATTPDVVRP
jgi:hypothetical protein